MAKRKMVDLLEKLKGEALQGPEEPIEIRNARMELEFMNQGYFNALIDDIQTKWNRFQGFKTAENEYLYEKSCNKYKAEKIKFETYQHILRETEIAKDLIKCMNDKLQELENENKILQAVVIGMQQKIGGVA